MSNKAITTTTTMSTPTNEVRIWVSLDEDANRVSAVLEALGYTVLRELEQGDGPARLRWAVNRLVTRHKLTPREQDILEHVLGGRSNQEIGRDLEISRATVKWHMHNIFAKSNTGNREALLRLALQLGGVREQDVAEQPVVAQDVVGQPIIAQDAGGQPLVEQDVPRIPQAELATEPHKAANIHEPIPAAAVPSKSWV